MSIGRDRAVFLLGAGASVDAQIPASYAMIERIESLIQEKEEWRDLRHLYYFLKSAILFSEGIKGKGEEPQYNIEILLVTIEELLKRDSHPLFPFIGSWIPKLPEVAKEGFSNVTKLKDLIVKSLKGWITPRYNDDFQYYRGLFQFQEVCQFPLHVFSLNYDLAIEVTGKDSVNHFSRKRIVERGFEKESHKWDWRVLTDARDDEVDIFLYKLHGSIDWIRGPAGELIEYDNLQDHEENEIIFGTAYKMQYADPFLFFAYEFRRRTLTDAKIVFCVGYSFSDDHINKILQQAIKADAKRKIVSVAPCRDENQEKARICSKLKIEDDHMEQIIVLDNAAKDFFDNLTLESVNQYVEQDDNDIPFDSPALESV